MPRRKQTLEDALKNATLITSSSFKQLPPLAWVMMDDQRRISFYKQIELASGHRRDDAPPYAVTSNRFIWTDEIEPMLVWCDQNIGARRTRQSGDGWRFFVPGVFYCQSEADMTMFILAFTG